MIAGYISDTSRPDVCGCFVSLSYNAFQSECLASASQCLACSLGQGGGCISDL